MTEIFVVRYLLMKTVKNARNWRNSVVYLWRSQIWQYFGSNRSLVVNNSCFGLFSSIERCKLGAKQDYGYCLMAESVSVGSRTDGGQAGVPPTMAARTRAPARGDQE